MSVITIGVVGPKTGHLTELGHMLFTGTKQAIKDVNAKGGVDGKMLQAREYDDGGDPKQATAAASKIVNDGVRFVIGHMTSDCAQTASDIYEDEGVVFITPGATSPEISTRGHRMVFRTIGIDTQQANIAVKWIVEHEKPKVVAVVHDKQQYGAGLATAVQVGLEARDIKVGLQTHINVGDKDFSSLIAELKQLAPDLVYYGGYYPELGQIMRQARQSGLPAKFMAGESVADDGIHQIAKIASEGLLVTVPRPMYSEPKNRNIIESFKADNQNAEGVYVLPSYAAVQLIAGLGAACSEGGVKAAEALAAGSFDTVIGDVLFDAQGNTKDTRFEVRELHFGKRATLCA